jgi:hypothetical protein
MCLRVGPREKKEEVSFSFISKARKAKGPHGISRSQKHRRRYGKSGGGAAFPEAYSPNSCARGNQDGKLGYNGSSGCVCVLDQERRKRRQAFLLSPKLGKPKDHTGSPEVGSPGSPGVGSTGDATHL